MGSVGVGPSVQAGMSEVVSFALQMFGQLLCLPRGPLLRTTYYVLLLLLLGLGLIVSLLCSFCLPFPGTRFSPLSLLSPFHSCHLTRSPFPSSYLPAYIFLSSTFPLLPPLFPLFPRSPLAPFSHSPFLPPVALFLALLSLFSNWGFQEAPPTLRKAISILSSLSLWHLVFHFYKYVGVGLQKLLVGQAACKNRLQAIDEPMESTEIARRISWLIRCSLQTTKDSP